MMEDEELLRYSRQIMLEDIEIEGQQALQQARVLLIGVGGLGSPVAMYLAAAGVGCLVLVDDDDVDLSNLQRQIIHQTEAIGYLKVESARQAIDALNPHVQVVAIPLRLQGEDLAEQVAAADVIVDASDNFSTRFALNAACIAAGKPLVSGAAIAWEGQVSVFDSRQPKAPCYRCLYQEQDDASLSCSESGVVAPLVGIIGAVQAMEVVKLITSVGESLAGRLLCLDAKTMQWRELRIPKRIDCPACGQS
ncbi:MAG: molybdopterin-synthase adenylyltransferase MoeB [Pseudomonadales bacterium]